MQKTDVIIIGSGLGGLAAGAILARKGLEVQVFERHTLPGGYATSFEREGYRFDVSLHGIGGLNEGGTADGALKACGVEGRIKPIRKSCAYSIEWKGESVDVPDKAAEYAELLRTMFPNERGPIDELFRRIEQFEKGFAEFNRIPSAFLPKLAAFAALPLKAGTFFKWTTMTTAQVIRSCGLSDEFIEFFAALWPYYGLPPEELSALYFFIPWLGYHKEGTFYIEGGGQALSDALTAVIEENGGRVHLRSGVTEILRENGTCTGVRLKKGGVWTAERVISNASPQATYELLPGSEAAASARVALQKQQIGISLSQLYIGLDCEPAELGIAEEELLMHSGLPASEDYRLALAGEYERIGLNLTNYTEMDPSQNKAGQGVLTLTLVDHIRNWPEDRSDYRKRKAEVTAILLDRLERHYPGLGAHVAVAELGTPRTMRRYTGNPEGAVYGFAQTVSQSGIKRLKHTSALRNLTFAGAWTQPGGGYLGALMSGYQAAEAASRGLTVKPPAEKRRTSASAL
ncbi:NAD(P)/FAD-dependent oxidoreductase [Saccharibacillus sp. CPCC 101409]|uniref:phytoene desaturase family protein n=1 Tax=Saccharibacillus sp. CPCC 101409 TaxID=3058041 RepID=UPI0026730657|nr:NAD(P)/FAD-dependent oxidoreductase [Saccharibacillus sp. CPCC 101409]MDO3408172.1 NAD(P)/FAD-dependent oxidoreductase [Saccharibacillus sp. CPCC 101409]